VVALLVLNFLRDRRSFSNAILLGFAFALVSLGVIERLARTPGRADRLVLIAVLLLIVLGPLVVAAYLVLNGIVMARREGLRVRNLLSLLAGLGIVGVGALAAWAPLTGSFEFTLSADLVVLLSGYVSFQFVSFVVYAWLYGHLPVSRRADFVVVLGSGLLGGGRVPPLLASRLDRGRAVFGRLSGEPMLIVSGGKGDDEQVSEAAAMAAYLEGRGFPLSRVLREEQSRTTEENLVNSKVIMEGLRPRYSCVIVTSSFHVYRAAIIARRTGVHGQATGARTAHYYRPSATIREFAAIFLSYRWINLAICALIVAAPLAYEYLWAR
jgi:uncharacterized SAM-binding protein YcdF (DUF218 family)